MTDLVRELPGPNDPDEGFGYVEPPRHEAGDPRDLQLQIRDWREGRATRNLWEAFQDAYIVVLAVIMIGAMGVTGVVQAQSASAVCATDDCDAARTFLPWAMLAGVLALTLAACHLFGPVVASAAEGFWLMDSPVRRSRLLRPRLVTVIVAAGLTASALSALVAAVTGSAPLLIGLWAVAGALLGSSMTALAAAEQGADRSIWVKTFQWIATTLAVAALMVVIAVAANWMALPVTVQSEEIALAAVSVLAFAVLVAAGSLAFARLNRIRRMRLTTGGNLVSGLSGAFSSLDFGLARDILVEQEAERRGHVQPTRGRGEGLAALFWRDVQRVVRYPVPLLGLIAALVVPYAAVALGLRVVAPALSALVLVMMLVPFMNSLRVLSRTKGLERLFPFSPRQLRSASMRVPALLAVWWTLASIPAFWGLASPLDRVSILTAIEMGLITGLAGFLGAVRWITAKGPNFGGAMIATGAGAMPPGVMLNLIKGIDIVALITAPYLLGAPVWVSMIIGVITYILLSGGMNSDAIREEQEKQKALAEKAREEAQKKAAAKRR